MATTLEHLQAINEVIVAAAHEGRRIEVLLNRLLTEATKAQALDPLTKSHVLDVLHCLYSLTSQAELAQGAIQTAILTDEMQTGE
jgi:hypothetical protein